MKQYPNVDTYIADFPDEVRNRLQTIRELIKDTTPEAEEVISYGMPAFKYKKRILVYYAAFKNHIGFYALPSGKDAFIEKLSEYKTSKGTIQFPHKNSLPLDLIKEIVIYRMEENELKSEKKQLKSGNFQTKNS